MTVISESAMHVVKPVVFRISLAVTTVVKAARRGTPTSHRDESGRELILGKDSGKSVSKIFLWCHARCLAGGRQAVYTQEY